MKKPLYHTCIDHAQAAQMQHAEIARLTGLGHGRMLEFGCGNGAYLKYFQEHGWECLGIATSEEEYQEALSNEVLSLMGDIGELNIPQQSYDIVRVHDSVDSAEQRSELLAAAFAATHPTGYIILDAWNGSGWPACPADERASAPVNKAQIRELLTEAGFEGGGSFAPALGDSIWAPLLAEHTPSFLSRTIDRIGAFFDRGSLLIAIAQRPPKQA